MGILAKRGRNVGGGDAVPGYGSSGEDRQAYPYLTAFVVDTDYSSGEKRVPGSITLFCEGGQLKACLNDKDGGLVGFTTIDSLERVQDALEGALREERVDWRPAKERRGGR